MATKTTAPVNLHSCLTYGISHTKEYKPSIIAPFLIDKSKDGKFLKRHSDAFLLLRQNKLQQTIGTDAIRAYLDNQRAAAIASLIPHDNLTDDELFQLIEPKEVNNLTTAYEFAQYLEQNSKQIKAKHKELSERKNSLSDFYKKIGYNSKTE